MRSNGPITVFTRSIVNPENKKVIFYLGKKSSTSAVDFTVATDGNIIVNASIYVPIGKLLVYGHPTNKTYLTGKFIAQNIDCDGMNVVWNSYNCSASVSAIATSPEQNRITETPVEQNILEAQVSPNPAAVEFTLVVKSSSTEPVEIRVIDMLGRSVHHMRGSANQYYKFGQDFISGAYIVQVLHGTNVKTLKIIKNN